MDGQDGVSQLYVDPSVLETLRCELEPDAEYCAVFVNSYIQQLPRRLDRLRHAVEAMDLDAAMDAVLSKVWMRARIRPSPAFRRRQRPNSGRSQRSRSQRNFGIEPYEANRSRAF
jgi:hypothetical protein